MFFKRIFTSKFYCQRKPPAKPEVLTLSGLVLSANNF